MNFDKLSIKKWLMDAGFTECAIEEGTYQRFWKAPNGSVVTERVAQELAEEQAIVVFRRAFSFPLREEDQRREDRKFFAGLAMRALIGLVDGDLETACKLRNSIVKEAICFADEAISQLKK